ncbi:outer membrane lipoprotein chaperone LolA [Rhizobacter sp. Root404]|jgi:outer membrane lipoprotein carrier protein|uniref:outer membrane lipoprotein chaperone LolA n=1 Tax=Rhizobacter sp. Root404 TaxID=1736528 RepID=UPI0006FF11CA|nr:outer membrane lipoprotein chaperone LolA [Rhizobacter sp. Root404]KQW35910.1 outer membrane lipoprotein carrier protein LolA [Rhizobacter sp. Root404]
MKRTLIALSLGLIAIAARADSVDTLREFIRDVKSGRAQFTQTVTSPDGAKKKTSTGSFEFTRPNRFRFAYAKPFEQVIVADGQKVWIYDADLNQASSRKFSAALGATPAALLAGGSLDKDFDLAPVPAKDAAKDGLEWVSATPKSKEGSFKSVRVGFRGKELAAVEIVDAFDQRSLLQFSQFMAGAVIAPETFQFKPPPGADVVEQP